MEVWQKKSVPLLQNSGPAAHIHAATRANEYPTQLNLNLLVQNYNPTQTQPVLLTQLQGQTATPSWTSPSPIMTQVNTYTQVSTNISRTITNQKRQGGFNLLFEKKVQILCARKSCHLVQFKFHFLVPFSSGSNNWHSVLAVSTCTRVTLNPHANNFLKYILFFLNNYR